MICTTLYFYSGIKVQCCISIYLLFSSKKYILYIVSFLKRYIPYHPDEVKTIVFS